VFVLSVVLVMSVNFNYRVMCQIYQWKL